MLFHDDFVNVTDAASVGIVSGRSRSTDVGRARREVKDMVTPLRKV